MASALLTYGQFRAALLERYQRPPELVPAGGLEGRLAAQVFRPLETFLRQVAELETITDQLLTDASLSADKRTQLAREFQDILERIISDYQDTLLDVPTETVVAPDKA